MAECRSCHLPEVGNDWVRGAHGPRHAPTSICTRISNGANTSCCFWGRDVYQREFDEARAMTLQSPLGSMEGSTPQACCQQSSIQRGAARCRQPAAQRQAWAPSRQPNGASGLAGVMQNTHRTQGSARDRVLDGSHKLGTPSLCQTNRMLRPALRHRRITK